MSPGQDTASECEWMSQCRLCRGRVSAWRSTVLPGIVLFFLGTTLVRAQDVAEAARQEQSRKAADKKSSKHVYTNDDLKKAKILTPNDEARVAARKRQQEQASAEAKPQQQPPANDSVQTESLGEIARRYRNEKAAREAEEAAKKSYTPFRYELSPTEDAAPEANVGPVVAPEFMGPSLSDATRPSAPQKFPQGSAASRGRVSPFQPRRLAPAQPVTAVSPAPTAPPLATVPQPALPVSAPDLQRLPESGLRPVTVKRGDSWWALAAVYLGSGSRWTELRAMNAEMTGPPELLKRGARIFVPDGREFHADSSSRTERAAQLRIRAGDTLWALAREHLGRGSAWTCLANANPQIQDYRRMAIGTLVELPRDGATGTCADPGERLRR